MLIHVVHNTNADTCFCSRRFFKSKSLKIRKHFEPNLKYIWKEYHILIIYNQSYISTLLMKLRSENNIPFLYYWFNVSCTECFKHFLKVCEQLRIIANSCKRGFSLKKKQYTQVTQRRSINCIVSLYAKLPRRNFTNERIRSEYIPPPLSPTFMRNTACQKVNTLVIWYLITYNTKNALHFRLVQVD